MLPNRKNKLLIALVLMMSTFIHPVGTILAKSKFDDLKGAVVHLNVRKEKDVEFCGAGIVSGFDKNTIYIMTAYHVVEDEKNIEVEFFRNPNAYHGELHPYFDEDKDLAVIKVSPKPAGLRIYSIRLGDPRYVSLYETAQVRTIGSPLCKRWEINSSRLRDPNQDSVFFYFSKGEADLGNSGGALFNQDNELIGMVTDMSGHDGIALQIHHALKVLENKLWIPTNNLLKKVVFLSVSPEKARLRRHETIHLTAFPKDREKNKLSERRVKWFSSNTGVATVSSSGQVHGRQVGNARIKAVCEQVSAYVDIRVEKAEVYQLTLTPKRATVRAGQSEWIKAKMTDRKGLLVEGVKPLWTSSNDRVATVSSSGLVTGLFPGQAEIIATYQNKSQRFQITVKGGIVETGDLRTLIQNLPAAGKRVRIALITGLTGHLASYGFQRKTELQKLVEDFNNQGGIQGRRVELYLVDHAFNPASAHQALNKFRGYDLIVIDSTSSIRKLVKKDFSSSGTTIFIPK